MLRLVSWCRSHKDRVGKVSLASLLSAFASGLIGLARKLGRVNPVWPGTAAVPPKVSMCKWGEWGGLSQNFGKTWVVNSGNWKCGAAAVSPGGWCFGSTGWASRCVLKVLKSWLMLPFLRSSWKEAEMVHSYFSCCELGVMDFNGCCWCVLVGGVIWS